MKKIALALLTLSIMLSCMLYASPQLGELDFPLKKVLEFPMEGVIKEIAVADTWIAVEAYDAIVALDINTQEPLWSMNMETNDYGESFKMINNELFVASQDHIILIDRQGQKKEINLEPNDDTINIIRVASVYPGYLYVIRGSAWTLEVYDIAKNVLLWKMVVGRSIGKVFYDVSNNIVYITIDESVRAFDNSSGTLLWEKNEVLGQGILFESGILYVPVITKLDNVYRYLAIDLAAQKTFWEKEIFKPSDFKAIHQTIINDLFVISGNGMIAIDKASGNQMWTTPRVGEEFYTIPIEFEGTIYVQGNSTGAVYAISPDNGAVIGHVRLEDRGLDTASGGLYALKDGIVFSTRNAIVIYNAK